MGKGYNNYMCKKPFHPGSKANIKRAWMAEQKTENEKKKQEELKVQYEKEQELYNNRSLLSTESKDKLELNFMYQAPPGAKKERQKEDDEPEFKFEWQRKYNAPREDYAKGNADIKDQPFGIPVRNVRCIKCHKWGHINTDKECTLFSQASTSSMPTTSMDPMELMKQMREDGYGLKENVLGHHLNPAAANQQLIPSDESDPEMEFLKSLSASEKKKLLRKLKKLSKKQEKASHCKKKKSKKSGKSKSKDKSSDHKKKKRKKSVESESSGESGTESSSEESADEKQKKKKHSKKHSSKRKSKERDSSESSDSEQDEKTSKHVKNIQERKDLPEKKHVKSDSSSSQKKVRSVSSDSETESKKNKHKTSKHSQSKSASKEKSNSLDSGSEFEERERRKINYFQEEKSKESTKRSADISSDRDHDRNLKRSSVQPADKKSRSDDKTTKNHANNRSQVINTEVSKDDRFSHKKRSSSETQEGKDSQGYSDGKKIDIYEKKQSNMDSKPQTSKSTDNFKYDVKFSRHDGESAKNKEQRSNDSISNIKQSDLKKSNESNLHKEMNLKRKTDKDFDDSKQKKKKDNSTNYEEKPKTKNNEECTKIETKNSYSVSDEELPKKKTDKNEASEIKSKKFESVEQKRNYEEESRTSHYKKKKNVSDSDEVEKIHTPDEQTHYDCLKEVDESKRDDVDSHKKEHVPPDSIKKHENVPKTSPTKQKCNSPLHPDGFSHLCPQAKVQANYVQVDEEYQGKEHDDFRHFNRERRSPSVKQKYNS